MPCAGYKSGIGERGRFLRSFLEHPRAVGALLPTSQRAVSDMLDLARVPDAQLIVEFGAGSGVYTRELLRRMGPDARLLAFEVDPALVAQVQAEIDDPRLQLVAGLGGGRRAAPRTARRSTSSSRLYPSPRCRGPCAGAFSTCRPRS